MKSRNLLAFGSTLALSYAHSIFMDLTVGSTTYPISYGIRDPTYDGPITNVSDNTIACNGGPNPTTASPYVIPVTAGQTVQALWRHTLTANATNDPTYVIDPSHLGPVMSYMKLVTDATTDPGYGSGWFKIGEDGFNPTTGVWGVTNLIAATGIQQITIPACIANGQYLLRAEIIALHAASSYPGAQFYMECAQISVTGGTGTATPSAVSLPGAYSGTDPGILINIYYPTVTSYDIPGPTPFTCGGAVATTLTTSTKSSSTTSSSTKASSTTTSTSTTKASTSTTSTSSAATSTASGAALYGQCGGVAPYAGPFTCAQGTCTCSSIYYCQCL